MIGIAMFFMLLAFLLGGAVLELRAAWTKAQAARLRDIIPAEAWYGVGSDDRFQPRLREAAAYVQGLLDANRIIECERGRGWRETSLETKQRMRLAQVAVHARARQIVNRAK